MGFLQRLLGANQKTAPVHRDITMETFDHVRDDAGVEVVGEQYYMPAIAAFRDHTKGGAGKALLMREPTNPHDANAIAVYVWISSDSAVAQVGHLAAEDAVAYRPVFDFLGDRAIGCDAALAPHRGGGGSDGVVLHLGTPGELIAELWADAHPLQDHAWIGKTVTFSGFGVTIANVVLDREGQRLLARLAGCSAAPIVTKRVDVCVATNPDEQTTNVAKARAYGIPIVSEHDFWTELGVDATVLGRGLGRWAQASSRAWAR